MRLPISLTTACSLTGHLLGHELYNSASEPAGSNDRRGASLPVGEHSPGCSVPSLCTPIGQLISNLFLVKFINFSHLIHSAPLDFDRVVICTDSGAERMHMCPYYGLCNCVRNSHRIAPYQVSSLGCIPLAENFPVEPYGLLILSQ